jgi:hypothetical protein
MILRSIGRSVRDHDWLAVGIEIAIVVIGVFIGIQVSNWNEDRIERRREAVLLRELRDEAMRNAEAAASVGQGLQVGADAARRVLSAVGTGADWCPEDCWPTIVDLMHASQWQQVSSRWTTYDELRRAGLPSDRRIIESVEAFLQTNHRADQALQQRPGYRTRVRGRIPIELQDAYWANCFQQDDRFESYLDPCPRPASVAPVPGALVEEIFEDPLLIPELREWTSIARTAGDLLVVLPEELADRIAAVIDTSLGTT